MICARCNGKGYIGVMTNEEYIRTCSTEELVDFLLDVWYGIEDVINLMSEDGEITKKEAMLQWLQEKHR